MFKNIVVLLCFITIVSAGLPELLLNLFFKQNQIPTRVRTVEELSRRRNESVILDFIGLVEQYDGYTADEYNVTTEDGYILGLHRISGSPLSPKAEGKPVVYIQHGLFGSSDFFVVLGPEQALAFQLANAGYDVWLGNVRGNTYSRAHLNYTSKDNDFWDFRMDEMGIYDASRFIDVVLNETRQEKLTYIGYSMGTTLSYMLLSSKPEYNEKINLVISIAPVVYFNSSNGFVNTLASTVLNTAKFTNAYEILPHSTAISNYAKESCSDPESGNSCRIVFAGCADIKNMNLTAIPKILSYVPAGTSYYTLEHYQQLVNANGKFQKFDYPCGFFHPSCLNYKKYNQSTPPEYDLSVVTVPNVIFYSVDDQFAKSEDAKFLSEKLNNVVAVEEITGEKFNHLDFAWNINAKRVVYDRVLEIIPKYL